MQKIFLSLQSQNNKMEQTEPSTPFEWLKKRVTVKVYEVKNDYRKVSEKDILIDWLL